MKIPGVHHLPIPTPFQVGAINAYLLDGPPLTLIDVGPFTEKALASLETQLSELDRKIEGIEQVLITHPHMDHFGLAGEVKRRSGCKVISHPDAIEKLKDFEGFYLREQDFFGGFLVSMGMSTQTVQVLTEFPKSFSLLAPPVEVDDTLVEGEQLQIGSLRFDVLETPGHSPASLCFYEPTYQALFAGDHFIDGITPNPLLEMPQPPEAERPKSLVLYLESLEKINRLSLKVVFSGHRNICTDPQRVIDQSFAHQEKRSNRVLGMLQEEALTAFGLMEELFPSLPATEQFLGMSEAVGHLDCLVHQGKAQTRTLENIIYYEAT